MWLQQQLKNRWSGVLFKIFLFTLPFQSSILIYETSWGRGFTNPYTSLSLSISECFLFLSALLFFLENPKRNFNFGKKVLSSTFLLCLGIGALSLVLSPVEDSTLKFFTLIGLSELLCIYFLIVNKILKVNEIFKTLTWSMSFQALLALLQLTLGHSLGLGFLGEPVLSSSTAHLAKLQFGALEIIRSYGTFEHPNILGGFLAFSILGTLLYPPSSIRVRNTALVLQLLGLICSFSRSALLGLILGILMLSYRSVPLIKEKYSRLVSYGIFVLMSLEVFVLILTRPLPLLSDPAIQTRIEGYEQAVGIYLKHPLGTGWSFETLFLDENPTSTWMPWDYQPTHNIFLLAWVETGFQGLFAFILLLFFTSKKLLEHEKILGTSHEESKKNFFFSMGLILVTTGFFDHYWMTLEPARFLAIILFSSISRFLSDPVPIKAIKKLKKSKPTRASLE